MVFTKDRFSKNTDSFINVSLFGQFSNLVIGKIVTYRIEVLGKAVEVLDACGSSGYYLFTNSVVTESHQLSKHISYILSVTHITGLVILSFILYHIEVIDRRLSLVHINRVGDNFVFLIGNKVFQSLILFFAGVIEIHVMRIDKLKYLTIGI